MVPISEFVDGESVTVPKLLILHSEACKFEGEVKVELAIL